jgi:hypothetical protein
MDEHQRLRGAIYGLVLGSSIIAAASADHPRQAGLVEMVSAQLLPAAFAVVVILLKVFVHG